MNINADITLTWPHSSHAERKDTPMELTIRDRDSGIEIATVYLTTEQFAELTVGSLAHVPVPAKVADNLQRIGKRRVRTPLIFQMPADARDRRQEAARIALRFAAQKFTGDYVVDTYFNSQDSFQYRAGGDLWAKTSVSTWEPVNESVSNPESEG